MRFISYRLLLAFAVLGALTCTAEAEQGDSALPGNHPLSQADAGEVLISELRCAACHRGLPSSGLSEKTAPDLSDVGARISPGFLERFLASPSNAHPGTTMPDLLSSRSEAERNQIAEALTHFLIAQSKNAFNADASEHGNDEEGKRLFHSVGCVACHGPKEAAPNEAKRDDWDDEEHEESRTKQEKPVAPIAVPIGHIAAKYSQQSLSEFLFQPLRVRSSGRMPDMKLTPAESLAIAGYLLDEPAQPIKTLVPDASLVSLGRSYFKELNCAACHALPNFVAKSLVDLTNNAELAHGCLSETPQRSPRFQLTPAQTNAMAAVIQRKPVANSDKMIVAKTLTAFHCIACHARDDFGGVHETHNAFFTGNELKLGDDGRIPPPLTLVGAKLRPAWLKKVLFDGESVRPYMATRMPQYGTANLQHLPDTLGRLDVLDGPEMKIPNAERGTVAERAEEKLLRAAGRELLGDKGANCVACHTFNGKAAQVNQGIDLLTSYERLQPAWFNRYLRAPSAFRPRTVMPTAWPDGQAAFTTILDGDTDRQIQSIWYYLSLGTSAADPSGVRAVNTKIVVDEKAHTHRGRSRVAGFRGIAVGLPEKISYAFNAETGTLSAIWKGEFISVNWSGQGSGDFNPASNPITLPQDVSFAQLADDSEPWPLMPVMTKDAKTNPNAFYPKNVGYQFRGYFLSESAIPTFLYRSGTMEIEDRSEAVERDELQMLKRTLQLDSPAPQTIWFRALVGDIQQESEQVFRSGRLRLTVPSAETKLRSLNTDPQQSELLLRLQLPQGKTKLEFLYEPLK